MLIRRGKGACGGWGSPVHQKKGPPGSCPCHIAEATPGGSDGVTTDYLKGIRFFAERGLKQTVGGCGASCGPALCTINHARLGFAYDMICPTRALHACSVPAPHVGPT